MDVERAGGSPPAPPTGDGLERELPSLLDGVDSVGTVYVVRVGLAAGSDRSVGERLVGALEDKVTVLGSTLEAGFDPSSPELDVLIETDHDHGAIATSLSNAGPVDGVVVADVTAAAERELEDEADEADAADANDVFNELKEQVNQLGYGDVVDELEDVEFPGGPDPDEEIDLEAETGVGLLDEDPDPVDLEDDDEALDLDDGAIDLDDEGEGDEDDDELSMKQLLGEEERPDDQEVKAPDEQAIEQAIEEVELQGPADDGADDDAGQSELEPEPAAEAGDATETGTADADDATETGTADADEATEAGTADADDATGAEVADAGDATGAEAADGGDGTATADAAADGAAPGVPDDGAAPGVPDDGAAPGVPDDVDAFVARLVQALQSGAVNEDRQAALREALGIESTHSLDVRLEYLQKRVDNLAAYTDSWEAFLSEQGSGREFMASVRDDLDAVEERLAAVEEDDGAGGAAVVARLDAVDERLDDLEATLSGMEGRTDGDIARLDTRIDDLESKFDGRLGTLEEKVKALLQWREHINDVLGSGK